jgi:putative resolvase
VNTWRNVLSERYPCTRGFARLLGVLRVAVVKWIRSGRIVAYSVYGKWGIPYNEVERVLRGVQRVKCIAI